MFITVQKSTSKQQQKSGKSKKNTIFLIEISAPFKGLHPPIHPSKPTHRREKHRLHLPHFLGLDLFGFGNTNQA